LSESGRRRVTAEARRKAVEQTLAQLARTMEQMESAVAYFPPDFDSASFGVAWYSKAPEERNRAMLVRSNMDDLHNLCQSLIDRSVRVAQDLEAIPADRKTPATDQLRAQGLYSRQMEDVMQEVAHLRNASQHEYWTVTAEDIHVAVTRQRRELPSFVAAVGAWVETLFGDRDLAE
jgi:uncharacterized protein YutE (UPF0331/DUF86 family)